MTLNAPDANAEVNLASNCPNSTPKELESNARVRRAALQFEIPPVRRPVIGTAASDPLPSSPHRFDARHGDQNDSRNGNGIRYFRKKQKPPERGECQIRKIECRYNR